VQEYKGHKCSGYNIAANFFGNEEYVLTGSENYGIFLYNAQDGSIEKKFKTHSKVVHLVKPIKSGS
jgi:hypothetical protein